MEVDSTLLALFGSETRFRLLAVLANAQHPLTGYRVAKTGEVSISKAYPELNRLAKVKLAAHGPHGWTIVDKDVALLLRKRVHVVDSEDWFKDKSGRDREDRALLRRLKNLPPPDWNQVDPNRINFDVDRRREKDAILVRHGLKPSVTDG
ncbi:MAG: hypothetical protein WA547_01665 [Thermoplasmata archaeon]